MITVAPLITLAWRGGIGMKREIIDLIIDYLMQHFDEDLSVGDVADHFHFSKFHLCRAFKKETGESLYAFIKRLKMDQSAVDIKLEKNKPITDIGLDYGYTPNNYSNAFKKHHHISPTEFRKLTHASCMPNPFYPRSWPASAHLRNTPIR